MVKVVVDASEQYPVYVVHRYPSRKCYGTLLDIPEETLLRIEAAQKEYQEVQALLERIYEGTEQA